MRRMLKRVLESAGLEPKDIDFVSAHGTATEAGDKVEAAAIRDLLGKGADDARVSATKSMTGHAISASGVFETIAWICKLHPKESWPVVASTLEDSEISWALSYWLGEPQRSGSESYDGGRASTPIDYFEPRQILDWIAEKPERADLIMQSLPKTLDQGRAGDLTRGFIEFFGPKSMQGRHLMGHFDTGVRSGPDSVYYSQRRDAARSWMGATTSPRAREWLGDFISMLSRMIDEAQIREERSF